MNSGRHAEQWMRHSAISPYKAGFYDTLRCFFFNAWLLFVFTCSFWRLGDTLHVLLRCRGLSRMPGGKGKLLGGVFYTPSPCACVDHTSLRWIEDLFYVFSLCNKKTVLFKERINSVECTGNLRNSVLLFCPLLLWVQSKLSTVLLNFFIFF